MSLSSTVTGISDKSMSLQSDMQICQLERGVSKLL